MSASGRNKYKKKIMLQILCWPTKALSTLKRHNISPLDQDRN